MNWCYYVRLPQTQRGSKSTGKTKVSVFQSQALICSYRPWKVSRQKHSLAALTLESWSTQVCSVTAALMQSSTTFHLCIQLGFNAPFRTSLSIELMDHGSESQPQRKQMTERGGGVTQRMSMHSLSSVIWFVFSLLSLCVCLSLYLQTSYSSVKSLLPFSHHCHPHFSFIFPLFLFSVR